jgi:hypothetical protein
MQLYVFSRMAVLSRPYMRVGLQSRAATHAAAAALAAAATGNDVDYYVSQIPSVQRDPALRH